MVERAEREPTMEEIVVALRETRRGAGRGPSLTVVGGQPGGKPGIGYGCRRLRTGRLARPTSPICATARSSGFWPRMRGSTSASSFSSRSSSASRRAAPRSRPHRAAIETDRDAIFRGLRAALEAELRPVLLVMLRLLQRSAPSRRPHGQGMRSRARPSTAGERRPTTRAGLSISMRALLISLGRRRRREQRLSVLDQETRHDHRNRVATGRQRTGSRDKSHRPRHPERAEASTSPRNSTPSSTSPTAR